jgi:hypothetical protein
MVSQKSLKEVFRSEIPAKTLLRADVLMERAPKHHCKILRNIGGDLA